eukprot:gnl/Dysnectes_brevis/301_a335_6178.p1 GENE.gnl/Dysnectes_brevis/301_a335_6178~~gnl/Dysnectes_brevis/301_a335_6178.p1  ORF type:complete len:741 (+),score=334.85 gnl/Dysnectes_brevis/301_a335_6178:354-2576(+)
MEVTAKTLNLAETIVSRAHRYDGDSSFLCKVPTARTKALWDKLSAMLAVEREKGVYDIDIATPSTVTSHGPGYIDQELEQIVGVQTDVPLKRSIKPYGGVRVVANACKAYGYTIDPAVWETFSKHRMTHNDGVFSVYTAEMRLVRNVGIITGLPDGYGRGRIIGDYRRIAEYGVDYLIELKKQDKTVLEGVPMNEKNMLLRLEISEQIKALKALKTLGSMYGLELERPAKDSKEAIQWTYFGYLGSVKEQDGAAMSFGRIDNFLDHYIERDLAAGNYTESEIQEMLDHFIMKLRIVRHLRTPEYNDLFAGDPTWVTLVLGGCSKDGRHLVCRTSFRIMNTLYTLGPAPEPNLTVFWSENLPQAFKEFAAQVSIDTSSIQYENDDLMRPIYGDDYGIACCVSAMAIGKQMQFFGARCNMAKLLLYTLNKGVDEIKKKQVSPITDELPEGPLVFEQVRDLFAKNMEWLAELYVKTMNIIHWSHDRYSYEALQMGLHDTHVHRIMAFGIAGLSHAADSFSAMKYAKVTPIRDEDGIAYDFKIEGDFPKFGNDDDRADDLAKWCLSTFMNELRKHETYRESTHSMSILTITSNVVYGRKTGTTPDGRKRGSPMAPGASPSYGADTTGALNSLSSVAKLPYEDAADGISNTFAILPSTLGKTGDERRRNLVTLINGYFTKQGEDQHWGHHLNVNCVTEETLRDAMEHPEKYPQLTVRVSGYAVNFIRLSREQQMDVLSRTFHSKM